MPTGIGFILVVIPELVPPEVAVVPVVAPALVPVCAKETIGESTSTPRKTALIICVDFIPLKN
jgi:hypothetical protein